MISKSKDTDEIKGLLDSMQYKVVKEFIQLRKGYSKYYVGKGKLYEISDFLNGNKVDRVVVNDNLKPSQWFNMECVLKTEVIDWVRLILEIFVNRAHSREAKLQVELARLKYDIPLISEIVHRTKLGEHPGFLAGGEYRVDQYYYLIRRRIRNIEKRLKKITADREQRRSKRRRKFYLVSIAGYTNAGKSTIMRNLTGKRVTIDDRPFSSLSSAVGRTRHDEPILMTDTVGFIQNIPPNLIEAFRSTLEEIYLSDVVVLVLDLTDDVEVMRKKLKTCLEVLFKDKNTPPIIYTFNKVDLLSEKRAEEKVKTLRKEFPFENSIIISAINKKNLESLKSKILSLVEGCRYIKSKGIAQ